MPAFLFFWINCTIHHTGVGSARHILQLTGSGVVWLLSARGHNAIMAPPPTNKGADLGFCSEGWYAAARAERDMPGLYHPSKGVCKAPLKGPGAEPQPLCNFRTF